MISETKTPHLGHYRLDSKLGEGGMGVVYQAMDEKLHREVAVKVLHPHLLQNENLKERFRREARMHAKLMHPNVVTLLSLYEDGEHMALVMEMVHGKNLKEYLKVNPAISLVDLVKICDAILAGLEAAHHLGMVHRDLKPANVLLSGDGSVKLMDFGLAKPKSGGDDLTQSGATVGSFRYMAPEQILNQPVDARTDLYAFGILLYQVCTGKLPFDATASGGGEFEIMEKQVREEPVPPHKLVSSIPLGLSDLILRLLEKTPAKRPVDCKEVRNDLHALLRQESRDSNAESIRMPTRLSNDDSNAEIAKGLLRALARKLFGVFRAVSDSVKPGIAAVQKRFVKTAPTAAAAKVAAPKKDSTAKARFIPARLTWVVLILFVGAIGWLLVSVLDMAERPASPETSANAQTAQAEKPVPAKAESKPAATTQTESKPEPVVETAVAKPVVKEAPKPAPKPVVKAAPKPAPKAAPARNAPKSSAKLVTDSVGYKVKRSDSSDVEANADEFHGGSRVWYTSLENYRWKDRYRSYKKGETRIYLDDAVSLSRIVLNTASVGRLDFSGGEVTLAVQNSRGQWTELFERKDDDVDIAVTLTGSALKDVKSVRLRFKTPEPITIGPIDLIR